MDHEGATADMVAVGQRRRIVKELQALAVSPGTTETAMQRALGGHHWIFGGQYVGIAKQRRLLPMDEYDIPLIRDDGSLEIVELKGPNVRLIDRHRSHYVLTSQVHQAIDQCINYLRSLDELGMGLQQVYENGPGLSYDLRRPNGIVIIGHPGSPANAGVERTQIEQTIRSYNASVTRVRVLTYAGLLESAERALTFEG